MSSPPNPGDRQKPSHWGGRSPQPAPPTPEPLQDDQASVASSASIASSRSSDVGVPAPASIEAAVHEVPSLLSRLVSGQAEDQTAAARKLFRYCRAGEAVQQEVVARGGVHMLLIMLDSLDTTVRDLCARILTDLAAVDSVRLDIASAPGGVAKVVKIMYKGVLEGQASAGKFLEMLATSDQEAVQAACCHAKVVRMLTKTIASTTNPRAMAGALGALRAFCASDAGNVSKMVWAGGVPALIGVVDKGDAEQCLPALMLLGAAARASPDSMQAACTPHAIELLSQFIGSSEADLQAQALAAEVLAAVAALPRKRDASVTALSDHALPRACEVVRSLQLDHPASPRGALQAPGEEAEQEGERALLGACAAIVARLAQRCEACCRVVVYHIVGLRATVGALVATRQCGLAQGLLQASLALALGKRGEGLALAGPHPAAVVAADKE